jgi:hypothetical protein
VVLVAGAHLLKGCGRIETDAERDPSCRHVGRSRRSLARLHSEESRLGSAGCLREVAVERGGRAFLVRVLEVVAEPVAGGVVEVAVTVGGGAGFSEQTRRAYITSSVRALCMREVSHRCEEAP